ncbi:HET-domain-containing protein [Pleurostoma richardsiae]|uniref:HET-domain-containing protein n=1 Tax=Pleurostoma richardsiae TaxID=41990 RepID=A0AA38VXV5_9PEZI|nr:HET-domain-containing protein [Pleurostoma richardsiae]
MDAVKLTRDLEERYLWVDSLCIVQDDEAELLEQTAQMDAIYSGAVLTIIAAAGKDADAGLPGIQAGNRDVSQKSVRVAAETDGRALCIVQTLMQDLGRNLQESTWNKRGWTLQERLLSKRTLVFTADQVFWNCQKAMWDEETILEPEGLQVSVTPQMLGCNDEWDDGQPRFSRRAFSSYVSTYSERTFTYHSDAFPAFQGVLRCFEDKNSIKTHWGLPCTGFDQELVWTGGLDRREEMCPLPLDHGLVAHVPYPSWSWLGCNDFVSTATYDTAVYHATRKGETRPELEFYKLMSDGTVRPVEAPVLLANRIGLQSMMKFGKRVTSAARAVFAEREDESPVSSDDEDMRTWEKERFQQKMATLRSTENQWKGDTRICGLVVITKIHAAQSPSSPLLRSKPQEPSPPNVPRLPVHDTGRLVFWTSHTSMSTWRESITWAEGRDEVQAELPDGSTIALETRMSGNEVLPFTEDNKRKFRDLSSMAGAGGFLHAGVALDLQEQLVRGDAVLQASASDGSASRLAAPNYVLDYIVISRNYPIGRKGYDRLNLLIVKWSETEVNVARKVGTATVAEVDWLRARREWKMIVLE